MPVSFQFLRTSDGQAEHLAVVDRQMCELSGVPEDKDRYCGLFQLIQIVGMSIASRGDGFTTSQEGFDKYRAEDPTRYEEEVWEAIHRFCVKDYNYSCWR